ncbi:hypothetical protein SAMN05216262_10587, partial [Colwellia chukchiensis]
MVDDTGLEPVTPAKELKDFNKMVDDTGLEVVI